jgi:predicted nuclease of predicted toxin-antitoxin system
MKFLVDAQLPRSLAVQLQQGGHFAIHTLDLPLANRTPDWTINELSKTQGYLVVSKDSDFVESFLLYAEPPKLLLISTGNITNSALAALFDRNIARS